MGPLSKVMGMLPGMSQMMGAMGGGMGGGGMDEEVSEVVVDDGLNRGLGGRDDRSDCPAFLFPASHTPFLFHPVFPVFKNTPTNARNNPRHGRTRAASSAPST